MVVWNCGNQFGQTKGEFTCYYKRHRYLHGGVCIGLGPMKDNCFLLETEIDDNKMLRCYGWNVFSFCACCKSKCTENSFILQL